MRLVRWDPFQDLVQSRTWAPPVDVFEKGDQLTFKAELPGIDRENLDVHVEDGVLTISGERKQDETDMYRRERVHGTFTRSFTLPKNVDGAKVTATYKDGILEVTVPKAEAAKPKKVAIQAA
ncbi:MAG TPA: Hsp20/alpha crystallin family protein [Candidatus Polarisedimenticolaceae bacterium]|nr:Hsp20/alpha crystallin family protein [Candidatus Polarisedimenticolaceae bacterium]